MFQQSKLGNIIGAVGFVGGILHMQKKGEPASKVVVAGAVLGICGYLLGNAITKFYE